MNFVCKFIYSNEYNICILYYNPINSIIIAITVLQTKIIQNNDLLKSIIYKYTKKYKKIDARESILSRFYFLGI